MCGLETKSALEPLRFFGSVGALCSMLGAWMLAIVVYQRLAGDSEGLYARQAFLIAVTLMVLGVQIVGFGLVTEIVARIVAWWSRMSSK